MKPILMMQKMIPDRRLEPGPLDTIMALLENNDNEVKAPALL